MGQIIIETPLKQNQVYTADKRETKELLKVLNEIVEDREQPTKTGKSNYELTADEVRSLNDDGDLPPIAYKIHRLWQEAAD